MPGPDELEGRLGLVLHVVYLIFTEGYAATDHHDLIRCDLQAAIAAVHDEAPSAQETDWRQVHLLYDELFALTPSPVVALNRAIAISWHEGPQAGLDLLEALAGEPGLARQHWLNSSSGWQADPTSGM